MRAATIKPCMLAAVVACMGTLLTTTMALAQVHVSRVVTRLSVRPDTTVVYGPATFDVPHSYGSGTQWTYYEESFTISSLDSTRRYIFRITNGDPDGTHRVNAVDLSLNGHAVTSLSDVTGSVAFALKVATPLLNNTMVLGVRSPYDPNIEYEGDTDAHIALDMISTPDPAYEIYGPTEFVMEEIPNPPPPGGSYTEYTDSLTRPSSAVAPYTLVIENGALDGSQRVASARVHLNGSQVVAAAECGPGTARVMRQVSLAAQNEMTIRLAGDAGAHVNISFMATDTTPPLVTVTTPGATDTVTTAGKIGVAGSVTEGETGGIVRVNQQTAFAIPGSFMDSVALATDGRYLVTVAAVNGAGYGTDVTRTLIRDTRPPTLNVGEFPATTEDSITVSGTWIDSTRTIVEVDGEVLAAGDSGAFSVNIPLDMGANGIYFRATDAAGQATSFKRFIFRKLSGDPDPGTVTVNAPDNISLTKHTPFLDQVRFLFDANAVGTHTQFEAAGDSIRPEFATVIRGRVRARDYGPLPNVKVRVLGHSEYGYALTRADGQYDLVVNGGSPVTLRFTKSGYLEAQRVAMPPVNDYVTQDDVALIGRSQRVHAVGFDSMSVVRGRFATDANGDRRIEVLFQAGTVAHIARTPGDTVGLNAIHLRLTEYTVGPDGPAAMPALLPPTSAYTYCVDFSVDEADSIGQAAQPTSPTPDVLFSKAVVFYVPNFLGFAVGMAVPNGYYERRLGRWVGGQDGCVVKVLGDSAGLAILDTDGDGQPDTSERYDSLGVTSAELHSIAADYDSGSVLWRMPVERFSNADCNLNLFPLTWLPAPSVVPIDEPRNPCPEERNGSIVLCEDRILGEQVPLAGTPYSVNYWSMRAQGDAVMRTIRVPVTETTQPPFVRKAIVQLDVVGRHYSEEVPGPLTSGMPPVVFTWDGKDAYGRVVNGVVTGRVSVGYEVDVSWAGGTLGAQGSSFGNPTRSAPSVVEMDLDRRVDRIVWTRNELSLGAPNTAVDGLGGWTISPHHVYDATGEGAVYLGDGSVIPLSARMLHEYAGGSGYQPVDVGSIDSLSVEPNRLAYGPGGALYIGDRMRHAVLRVDRDGRVSRIAGNNLEGPFAYASEGPATGTPLPGVITGLAVGPEGSVYLSSSDPLAADLSVVCVVTPDGTIRRIIGGRAGVDHGGGDELPASAAWTGHVSSLALGPDGSIFFGECNDMGATFQDFRIRRIGPNGIVSTYAGAGGVGFTDSSGRATNIRIYYPSDIVVDRDGFLYFSEAIAGPLIRRVAPNGIMTTLVNVQQGDNTPPGPVWDIDFAADGSLCMLTYESGMFFYGRTLQRRAPDGTLTVLAGGSSLGSGFSVGLPKPAALTSLQCIWCIGCNPAGGYVLGGYERLWREGAGVLDMDGQIGVPSVDGSEIFVFAAAGDSAGRHLYTRDALTGGVRRRFGYDGEGRLTSIEDAGGLTTTIVRQGGVPTKIRGPFGQETSLALDAGGFLREIKGPLAGPTQLTTRPDGLLATYSDERGNQHTFEYASDGRLALDQAPASTGQQLQLDGPVYDGRTRTVTLITGEGRETEYSVTKLWDGTRQKEIRDPAGLSWFMSDSTDNRMKTWWPSGMSVIDSLKPDPRFGMTVPVVNLSRTRLPSGLTMTVETARSTTAGFAPPHINGTWSEAVSINSRTPYQTTFASQPESLLMRVVSPEGRVVTSHVDSLGRPLTVKVPGLEELHFTYDDHGRVEAVTQGGRGVRYGYNDLGQLSTIRDTLQRMTTISYEDDGRPTALALPGGRTVSLKYDDTWNLTEVRPPGRPTHRFEYDPVNLLTRYTAPEVGDEDSLTEYAYNGDGQLTGITRPGGDDIALQYNGTTGRLEATATARGTADVTYSGSGEVHSIGSPDGVTVTYAYDGPIDTMETWSGPVVGSVSVALDRDFRVASQRVNRASDVTYEYDEDGLLTKAGNMTVTRRPDNGLISGTTLDGVTSSESQSSVGELWKLHYEFGGQTLFEQTLDRDSLGRIVAIEEVAFGTDTTYGYRYDDAGRLYAVTTNGDTTARYWYDANGNRDSAEVRGVVTTATYDAQDRLLRHGATTYGYTAAGELSIAITGTDTTRYTYDALGNLVKVKLASGDSVEYVVDGLNRRVGRKVNGAWTAQWLYNGARPIAETDSTGAVLARYVYLSTDAAPAYLMRGDTTWRFVADYVGSTRGMVDITTGAVVDHADYDAWGGRKAQAQSGSAPFGYAGGLRDPLTALVRFGARDYNPDVGRWTTGDPLRFEGGSLSLYAYVDDDPMNYVDPTGANIYVSYYSSGVGHVGIGVNGGRTIGRYPISSTWQDQVAEFFGRSTPALVKPDKQTPDDVLEIPTTAEQDQAVLMYIYDQYEEPGMWNLRHRNCVDYVRDALDRAHVYSGTHRPSPGDYYRSLKRHYGTGITGRRR